jgi:hypothetical protein
MPEDEDKKTPKPKQPRQPQLVLPPEIVPAYSNLVRIAHTPSEIIFDFSRFLPGEESARVQSRVLMSPLSAKLLQRALAENLAKYETTYGEIAIPAKQSLADFLFRPPPPEDGKED